MRKLRYIGIVAVAAAVLVIAPSALAASSKDGDGRVIKTGRCSAGSVWKLKAKTDDGRIETEFEVDQNRIGKRWRVTVAQNGTSVFSGSRTTVAPSGSFSLHRLLAPGAGASQIVATARAVQGGETCRATLSF